MTVTTCCVCAALKLLDAQFEYKLIAGNAQQKHIIAMADGLKIRRLISYIRKLLYNSVDSIYHCGTHLC